MNPPSAPPATSSPKSPWIWKLIAVASLIVSGATIYYALSLRSSIKDLPAPASPSTPPTTIVGDYQLVAVPADMKIASVCKVVRNGNLIEFSIGSEAYGVAWDPIKSSFSTHWGQAFYFEDTGVLAFERGMIWKKPR